MSAVYGARPVSVDLARGRVLLAAPSQPCPGRDGRAPVSQGQLPLTPEVVADRLSLAHWPNGHQIAVCSLSGGVGRTTVTGLLMSILAELPFAHIWYPIAGVELTPRTLGTTAHRWGVANLNDKADVDDGTAATSSGAWAFTEGVGIDNRHDFSAVVLDAPAGLPSELSWVAGDPTASVLLLARPDRASLAETAAALVWMHDQEQLARQRVVVLINDGAGFSDQGSRAAATAVRVRCAGVHRLPFHRTLGPGKQLPAGAAIPRQVRRPLTHAALDLSAVAAALRAGPHFHIRSNA